MLRISAADYAAIRRHGEETYPHECCGILMGEFAGEIRSVQSVIACTNAQTELPQNRYCIAPCELVRAQREARERSVEIVGFYHSHPDHPAQWSPTDLAEAHWIGCSYVITSVEKGQARETKSYVLTGTREEDKGLAEEAVVLTG